jgi:glycosyltransferase involved in cell wall biosynthesis
MASEAARLRWAQYLPVDKMVVVDQPVVLETHPSSPSPVPFKHNSGIKCAIVGALVRGKEQSEAIRAIGSLTRRGILAQLAIVGSGPDRERLEDLVETEGLRERVFFTGLLSNPFPVMQAADVILFCSRREARPRVVVEAMRLGKPIVAAASGGTPELVKDGFNGLLYAPGDHEQLVEKLLVLLESPSLQAKLGENGRSWAERFSLETYGATVLWHLNRALRGDVVDR